jgi:hypothetical protein
VNQLQNVRLRHVPSQCISQPTAAQHTATQHEPDGAPGAGIGADAAEHASEQRQLWDRHGCKEGRLWCAVGLSRAVVTTGALVLPSFVANFVQGDWIVLLPDSTETGAADCKGTFLKRLRKPLSYLGAELGDLVFSSLICMRVS